MNQDIGTFDDITLDYILEGLKMRFGLRDSTTQDLFLKDLINQGIHRIKSPNMFVQANKIIEIDTNFMAKLPCGFIRFEKYNPIRFVGADGMSDPNSWFGPQYINNAFFKNDPDTPPASLFLGGTVNIVNGYLQFSSDVTATQCKIAYLSSNYDDQGNLVIRNDMEPALIEFVSYQYKRENEQKYSVTVWKDHQLEYKKLKKALKGVNNLPDSLEQKLMAWQMNCTI